MLLFSRDVVKLLACLGVRYRRRGELGEARKSVLGIRCEGVLALE